MQNVLDVYNAACYDVAYKEIEIVAGRIPDLMDELDSEFWPSGDKKYNTIILTPEAFSTLAINISDVYKEYEPTSRYENIQQGYIGKIRGYDIWTSAFNDTTLQKIDKCIACNVKH